MLKNTSMWTLATLLTTVFVYIDILYISGNFIFTIPVAVLGAIISIIVSIIEKKYIYILVNIVIALIACVSFVILW